MLTVSTRSTTSTDILVWTGICLSLSNAASEKSPSDAGVKAPNDVATIKYCMKGQKATGVRARYKTQNFTPPSNTNNHATTIMPSKGSAAGATTTRCKPGTSICRTSHTTTMAVTTSRNGQLSQRCCARMTHSLASTVRSLTPLPAHSTVAYGCCPGSVKVW